QDPRRQAQRSLVGAEDQGLPGEALVPRRWAHVTRGGIVEILHQGSRAIPVKLLQRLLNKKGAAPRLAEDGIFGPRPRAAVVAFQSRARIGQDGVAGPATWSNLGLKIDLTHPVRQFGQPTKMTCWSAAATMIVGNMSVGPGKAAIDPSGGMLPNPDN